MSEDQDKLNEKIAEAEADQSPDDSSISSAPPPRRPSSQPPQKPVPRPPSESATPPRKPVPQLPADYEDLPPPYEPVSSADDDEDLPPPYEAPVPPRPAQPAGPAPQPPAFRRVTPSPAAVPRDARLGGARVQVRERGVVVVQRLHLNTNPNSLSTVNLYHKAQLVWPVAEHKQYVNLMDQGNALSIEANDVRRRGHKITVKTKLLGGKRGNQVFVKLEYGTNNSKRNNPTPGIESGIVADWCPQGGIVVAMRADEGQPNCEATFNLELGFAGGDEVTVYVGGNNHCADDQVKIINWRRIGFQITKPFNMEVPSLEIAKEALRDVFIEFERLSEVNLRHKDGPPGSWVGAVPTSDGRGWLKDGELIIGDHNRAEFEKKFRFAADKDPIAHLMFCHKQFDAGEPGKRKTVNLSTGGFDKKNTRLPHATSARFTLKVTEKEISILNPSLQDGKHPLVRGTWFTTAPTGHPHNPGKGVKRKMGDLTAANVEIDSDGTSVKVTLPPEAAQIVGDGKDISDKKHPIQASVSFHVAKGPYQGESNGEHILIVGSDSDKQVSSTICHEVGHSVNQTVEPGKAPPGLTHTDHNRSYDGKGHQGQHCALGLSATEFAKPELAGWKYAAIFKPRCLMWGDNGPQYLPWREVYFCELCRPFVIAEQCAEFKKKP